MPEPVILRKQTTDSTMEDARTAVRNGAGEWTVCIAGRQRAGRGRVPGRKWEDSGQSLLFTLVIHRESFSASYPPTQMLALALCLYLSENHGLEPCIKWPNDVLLDGRKIAGILVETEGPFFLAGLGLNLNQKQFPDGLRRPAVSLSSALAGKGLETTLSPDTELTAVLERIRAQIDRPADIQEVSGYLNTLGCDVSVALGDPGRNDVLTGTVAGLQDDGALVVRTPDGVNHPIYSGEIVENP